MTWSAGCLFRSPKTPRCIVWAVLLFFSPLLTQAQTNTNSGSKSVAPAGNGTNSTPAPAEQIRAACVEGRRYICGKVVQIVPDGLVVDSGYADLLNPPLNKSWVVPGTASVSRNPAAIEEKRPDAICVGLVFLTVFPKQPKVNEYDYVALHVYPCGDYQYKPVPGVEKTIRRFSGSIEHAVKLNLDAESGAKKAN